MTDAELYNRSSTKKEMINAWGISEADDDDSVVIKPKPRQRLETVAETSFDNSDQKTSSVHSLPSVKKPIPRRRKQKETVLSPRELESPSSKPSASDSGFALSPGRSSVSSNNHLEGKEFSEEEYLTEQKSKISVSYCETSFCSSTFYGISSSEFSLFSLKKPIPPRRKNIKNFWLSSELDLANSDYFDGDDGEVRQKTEKTSSAGTNQFVVSSSEHSLFTFKKPIPARRKHKQIFSAPGDLESPISRVSEHVLIHSPGKSSVSSHGRGDDKESGPSSLPARADTPASVSSHHPSVGDVSLDGSRSVTSQSDTRSYRERIRERVQAAKQGQTPTASAQMRQSRLKQHLLSKPVTSRFDVFMHKEEAKIEEALLAHEQARAKWSAAAKAVTELPSEQECFDFFTRMWETEPTEPEPQSPSSPAEDEGGENNKLISSEYLGIQDDWEIIEDVLPTIPNWEEIQSQEETLYFYPGDQIVPLELKLPSNQEPRYPEMEGLYVGRLLPIRQGSRNRMEQRIIATGELNWFGDDGEIISNPDPRSKVLYKPPLFEDICPFLEVEYKEAVMYDPDKHYILQPVDLNLKCLLVVEINSIVFTHHPLFSREHVLAQRLKDLYEKHCQKTSFRNEERLRGRLQALRRARNALEAAIEKSESSSEEQNERLKKYFTEVHEIRRKIQSECRRDKILLESVLHAWKDLKEVRENQGYINTPLQLKIQVQQTENPEKEMEAWDEMIDEEWHDLEREKAEEYNEQCREYEQKLNQWKKKRKKTLEEEKQRKREKENSIETDIGSDDEGSSLDEDLPEKEPKPPEKMKLTLHSLHKV